MQISNSPTIKTSPKTQATPAESQAKSPVEGNPPSEKSSVVRDVVAVGAGAVAGIAGGTYGLGEGLIKGAVTNYPKHVSGGLKVGRKALTPVGGATGALVAVGLTGAAAIAVPLTTALSAGLGLVGGTALSAVTLAPSSITSGAKQGAEYLSHKGEALGTVGATVGKYVGGALGGIGGAVAAVVKGVPYGWGIAGTELKAGVDDLKGLPQFAKDTWNTTYNGGRKIAGNVGAVGGATVGVVTGTGATVIDGAATSIKRGAQWANATSNYIKGEKKGS